jgi:hypothetical protein
MCHRYRLYFSWGRSLLSVRRTWSTASLPAYGTMYHDLHPNHFHARDRERQKNRLVKRLAQLGYTVALAPVPN